MNLDLLVEREGSHLARTENLTGNYALQIFLSAQACPRSLFTPDSVTRLVDWPDRIIWSNSRSSMRHAVRSARALNNPTTLKKRGWAAFLLTLIYKVDPPALALIHSILTNSGDIVRAQLNCSARTATPSFSP